MKLGTKQKKFVIGISGHTITVYATSYAEAEAKAYARVREFKTRNAPPSTEEVKP